MSIVVTIDTPGLTAENYEQAQAEMGLVGTLPDGCSAHIAGPTPDGAGWRVTSVWEDEAALMAFAGGILRPTFERLGFPSPAGRPIPTSVYRFQL